ncbi:MFS transporter [Dactylosporangium aurantiacum]|uniref:MFS transporter n=1 Tax=Dactylosporangium aurantiacum TaxID=35754 RepID=A0A9Q9ISB6_9ACTN|nr:MFS transporter [Dactylosporangium aurantiacum]MDG6109146.1 MFS transporter [Dactylosporangium aurantiacum]UWZ58474.1 MFS transporter [Dactylosporangium aurantiacum]
MVYLAVFVDMLGFGVILPLLPFRTERLGGSGVWLGGVLTAYALAQFVAAPVLGALSDRFGRRPLLLTSLAGSAVSLALTGVAGSLPALLSARVVAGLCGGAIAVGQAYAVDLAEPGERTRALGMVGASIGMGFVFGPAIGAALAGLGFAGVSFVAGGIALANLIAGAVLLPRAARPAGQRPSQRSGNPLATLVQAVRLRALRPLLGAVFAATFAFAGMEATYALLGGRQHGLGPRGLGLVFTGVGVVMAVVQGGVVGRVTDRFGDRRIAVTGAALLGLGLVTLPYGPAWLSYAALAVLATGQGLLAPTTATLIARAGGSALGGVLGIGQSASAAARAVGPIAAGAAFDLRPAMPYLLGAALCGLAAALILRHHRGADFHPDAAPAEQPA